MIWTQKVKIEFLRASVFKVQCFLGKPYQIATQIPTNKFQMMIRINNFPSFVTSKAVFDTKRINAYGTEWYIRIFLCKYCQTSNEHKIVKSTSTDQPETLGAFFCGTRSDGKECSFDVDFTFKFKRSSTAREMRFSENFSFNSTENLDAWGCVDFSTIDVI